MGSHRYWIPNAEDIEELVRKAGFSGVGELFSDIPRSVLARGFWDSLPIGAGRPLSEMEVVEWVRERLARVWGGGVPPFLGGGAWAHYVPAYQRFILRLGEFLTSYTPYQPEASQGLLQALFEYQSLMAEILDMDVVNSSHYDGSTALAEAVLMALRLRRGRRRVVVPDTLDPRYRKVLEAYLRPHGVVISEIPSNRECGCVDLEALDEVVTGETAAVVFEFPNSIGVVDGGAEQVGEAARRAGALYIVKTDPIAATLYKPPGELGADIAVAEGQPLGLGLNYGGPYLGVMAVRWDLRLIRQMPGRIAGLSRDSEGRRAFALILQAREQHIRRARATSNITTNEALMAVLAAAYIAGHGGEGLRIVAENVRAKTLYLKEKLRGAGLETVEAETWRDTPFRAPTGDFEGLAEALRRRKLYIGPPLHEASAEWLDRSWGLIAVTEAHRKRHIDLLVDAIGEALRR
ncbi:MAG: aminomethyl-transferring glycine dehydrogenase subunit GcvPA [Desulfurococcales archaeon]|nr:aminomethyl-transferring glycine dehydrogenase subunit GcvPA [Desulfurococcales archaeon]